MPPRTARSDLECASPLALWTGAPAKTATGPALEKVGRAILCPPPLANRCVLVHHAGAHGVTRPTTVGGWWPATKTWPRAVWGGRTGQRAWCGISQRDFIIQPGVDAQRLRRVVIVK